MPNISQEERDTKSPVWDMSQERLLLNATVAQRFQFFLLIFSLVAAGALNARSQCHLITVFCIGALLTTALAASLHHARRKLEAVLDILREDETHPYTIIMLRVGRQRVSRNLISYILPLGCCGLLFVATALAWAKIITVAP